MSIRFIGIKEFLSLTSFNYVTTFFQVCCRSIDYGEIAALQVLDIACYRILQSFLAMIANTELRRFHVKTKWKMGKVRCAKIKKFQAKSAKEQKFVV